MKHIKNYTEYIKESKADDISDILLFIRNEYEINDGLSPEEINSGFCEDVQIQFFEIIGGETSDTFMMDDGWFWNDIKSKYKTAGGDYWDVDNLIQYAEPPFDWEILRKFDLDGHCWIYHKGKHYDVETINGVENMWDLPIFQRQVERVFSKINSKN